MIFADQICHFIVFYSQTVANYNLKNGKVSQQ